jgi:hypothetical protein
MGVGERAEAVEGLYLGCRPGCRPRYSLGKRGWGVGVSMVVMVNDGGSKKKPVTSDGWKVLCGGVLTLASSGNRASPKNAS